MNKEQLIQSLKSETAKNPIFKAVMYMFAMRKRARYRVSISALTQKMRQEGFSYPKEDYARVIKFLIDHKLGEQELNRNGRLIGIKGLTLTLQSIGQAACSDVYILRDFKKRNGYEELPVVTPPIVQHVIKAGKIGNMSIQLDVNGREYKVTIPEDTDSQDVAKMINFFKDVNKS